MVSFQTYSVDPLAAEAIESCGAVSVSRLSGFVSSMG
jgi:hypothetical protein